MVSFQTKNPNLGKFWRTLDMKMLIYFMAIWNILQTFEIFCDNLVHFVLFWYIFTALVYCVKKNLAILSGSLLDKLFPSLGWLVLVPLFETTKLKLSAKFFIRFTLFRLL
jgi:hypothetical protein